MFCNQRAHLSGIAYSTKLISPNDVPKVFMDLRQPDYASRLFKRGERGRGRHGVRSFTMIV